MKIVLTLLAAILGLSDIDTRVGTASADSPTASVFGSAGEVYGNCVPCVTEPNWMTGWTAQTRISEKKGVAPYYYDDGEWLGFCASHWLIGSAVQDYGSFYILPDAKPLPMDHGQETATPGFYSYCGHSLTALGHSAIMKLDCDEVLVGIPNEYGKACRVFRMDLYDIQPPCCVGFQTGRAQGAPPLFRQWAASCKGRNVVYVSRCCQGQSRCGEDPFLHVPVAHVPPAEDGQ